MNPLPLIDRELRVALRRPSTYRLRVGCGVGAGAIALWNLFVWSAWQPTASVGQIFFHGLAVIGLTAALLSGLLLAADSISQEKREDTLGLLFLTPLQAPDIVVGKLIAKTILPLYGLLSPIPILALAVLIGGITAGESARMILAWWNALIVASAMSLWTSTYCRQHRAAHLSAGVVLFLLVVALPWLCTTSVLATSHPFLASVLSLPSPAVPYRLAFAKTYQTSSGWFWGALLCNQIWSWTFLGLATRRILRIRNDQPGLSERAFERSSFLSAGTAGEKRSRRALENRPIEWLELHKSRNTLWHWAGPAAVALLFAPWPLEPLGNFRAQEAFAALMLCHLAVKVWAAAQATYAFTADRRSGALESLLGTRISEPELAAGMFRGFVRRFAGPAVASTLLGLSVTVRLASHGSSESALVVLLATVLVLWDSYCLFWTGLFQGLAARSAALGLAATVFRILVLPWAWLLITTQLLTQSARPLSQFPLVQILVLWIILVLVNHLAFVLNARAGLRRYFRILALKPFGEKPPHIESDWSPISWDEEPEASQ